LREVEAPTLLRQTANRWRHGSQPYAPAALYSQVSFLRFLVLISVRGVLSHYTVMDICGPYGREYIQQATKNCLSSSHTLRRLTELQLGYARSLIS
jgi:hypothetical protein